MLLLATLVLSMGLALAISRIFLTCVFHLMTQRTLPFVFYWRRVVFVTGQLDGATAARLVDRGLDRVHTGLAAGLAPTDDALVRVDPEKQPPGADPEGREPRDPHR